VSRIVVPEFPQSIARSGWRSWPAVPVMDQPSAVGSTRAPSALAAAAVRSQSSPRFAPVTRVTPFASAPSSSAR
jgi:hypothetical protein